MIWAATLGYLLFAETPTASVLIGAGIVIATGAGMLARGHHARRLRPAAQKA